MIYGNQDLAHWAEWQRKKRREERLEIAQQQMSKRLGFIWEVGEGRWLRKYNEYKRSVEQKLPRSDALRNWLARMREQIEELSERNRELLKLLGLSPTTYNEKWASDIQCLEDHFKEHGSLQNLNLHLKKFVQRMKNVYSLGTLPKSKIERLERAGVCWASKRVIAPGFKSVWDMRYVQAEGYVLQHAGNIPPLSYWEDKVLGNWVKLQRARWKFLSTEQQAKPIKLRLDPRGRDDIWEKNFDGL